MIRPIEVSAFFHFKDLVKNAIGKGTFPDLSRLKLQSCNEEISFTCLLGRSDIQHVFSDIGLGCGIFVGKIIFYLCDALERYISRK